MKNIINLIVADEEKGQRIDSFVTIKENSLSRTRVKNLILKKKLKLNNLILVLLKEYSHLFIKTSTL